MKNKLLPIGLIVASALVVFAAIRLPTAAKDRRAREEQVLGTFKTGLYISAVLEHFRNQPTNIGFIEVSNAVLAVTQPCARWGASNVCRLVDVMDSGGGWYVDRTNWSARINESHSLSFGGISVNPRQTLFVSNTVQVADPKLQSWCLVKQVVYLRDEDVKAIQRTIELYTPTKARVVP